MLLDSARRDLQIATSDRDRIGALARIAVYLARRGDVDDALKVVSEIRSQPSSSSYTSAIASANLAEGVLAFCSVDFPAAADKLRRAVAMASTAREEKLGRWCEAWSAHIAFHFGRIEDMCRQAQSILDAADPTEHSALSRVASTLATACHDAGRFDLARRWYDVARRHAVAEGDDLTIDATLHNAAANHLVNLRIAAIHSLVSPAELDQAELELKSSVHYDLAKNSQSFRWMLPLLRIHLTILRNEPAVARDLLSAWISDFPTVAPKRALAVACADHAYCLAATGEDSMAMQRLREAVDLMPADAALDDLSIAFAQLAKAAQLVGDAALTDVYRAKADESLTNLLARQRQSEHSLEQLVRPARYGAP